MFRTFIFRTLCSGLSCSVFHLKHGLWGQPRSNNSDEFVSTWTLSENKNLSKPALEAFMPGRRRGGNDMSCIGCTRGGGEEDPICEHILDLYSWWGSHLSNNKASQSASEQLLLSMRLNIQLFCLLESRKYKIRIFFAFLNKKPLQVVCTMVIGSFRYHLQPCGWPMRGGKR